MTTPTPASVLRAALEVLRWDGWQPRPGSSTGPCCIMQATFRIAGTMRVSFAADAYIERVVGGSVSTWNDAQTSFAPVEAAFLRAIALAEAEEPPHAD